MAGVKDKVDAARFDRKISIQAPTISADAQGTTTAWNTVYTCFASIENQPHGRGVFRRYLYQQLYPQLTAIVQIRYQQSTPIDATMRIQYIAHGVTHIYQIIGIENPNEANISMYLLCQEQQAKSVN